MSNPSLPNLKSWEFMLGWVDNERDVIYMSAALEMLRVERLYGKRDSLELNENLERTLDVLVFAAFARLMRDYGEIEITLDFIKDFLSDMVKFVYSKEFREAINRPESIDSGVDIEGDLLVKYLDKKYGK